MRRDVKKLLKEAVVARFATGKAVTSLGLALDLGYTGKDAVGSNGAYVRIMAWKESGIVRMQPARQGPGESPHVFNFTGRPLNGSTGADALAPFLADPAVAKWEKKAAKSALRFVLDLPRKCLPDRIVQAARSLAASDLHGLPARAYDLTLAAGQAENTAEVRRTALRSMLRHAAAHDHIPMVFPSFRDEDPWEVQAVRYFPLESQLANGGCDHDLDAQTRSTYRSAFRMYGRACQLAFGSEGALYADPAHLPVEKVADVRAAVIKAGEKHRWAEVSSMLNWIGKVHEVGPRAGAPGGRRQPDYLYPDEDTPVSRYEGFLEVFDFHGFSSEFREFFEVYRLINTLSFDELESRADELPARRTAEPLKDTTLMDHTTSLRHWLGVAVYRLGMKPEEMTLIQVFGHDFGKILTALKTCWAEKADDPNFRVSAPKSGGLHAVIVNAGLVAYALWRYRGHRDGMRYRALVGEKTHLQLSGLNRLEEGEAMTEERRVLFEAYLESRRQADAINAARKNIGRTENVNTVKDLREIFRRTPPSYWVAILDAMIERVDRWNAAGRDDEEFHEEVLATMLHGGFIAAGARGAEFTHIRLDRHYPPDRWAERVIDLWRADRKNRGSHELCFWEGAPPRRIEKIYHERTRPYFMRQSGADHQFFFVDTMGRPFGCVEEEDDGTGRDGIAHRSRITSMRTFWSRKAAAAAIRAKLDIPSEHYGFTLHNLRGVFGLLIFHVGGLEWAMNYTGDRSPDTITGYYTALKARGIEPKEKAVLKRLGAPPMLLRVGEQNTQADGSGAAPHRPAFAEYKAEYTELLELRKMGALTEEEFAAHVIEVKKRYGIGA
jgi:hypothetical protein